MFPLANMFHFFAHKLARLGRRRFAFALVFARVVKSFFFWHSKSVSPLAMLLDVEDSVVARQARLLRPPISKSLRRSPNQLYGYKRIAIPRCANLVSAHAHNSVTDPAHPVTRRVADVAVQLRMGLLSKRRLGTYPFDCADFVADGTYLTTSPLAAASRALKFKSAFFGSVAQLLNAIVRLSNLGKLPCHNFLNMRRETVIKRLPGFFHRRIFAALTFSQNAMVITAGKSGLQVNPAAVQCSCRAAAHFGIPFIRTLSLAA